MIKGFEPSKTAPVEVGRLSPLVRRLLFIPGGCLEFLTHQQDGIGFFLVSILCLYLVMTESAGEALIVD